ncbi:MAG TPA: cytidylate kinase-like family protein [Caldilineaceae bacterium]|nr:cytidylate kinase-like family protein [Caldilineaceae bacterium]
MAVITVSRELGSFGTAIAEQVAARLSTVCVDKEVLAEMARQAGVAVEVMVEAEERLLSRPLVVSEEMRSFFAGQDRKQSGRLDEQSFITQMAEAIRTLAGRGNIVFVGRGAQLILAQDPQALHVHIYAPLEVRAARIQQRRGLADLETALRVVRQVDEQRSNWFRRFFQGVNWRDARHYHLMINTGRIPEAVAVSLVVQAAQA